MKPPALVIMAKKPAVGRTKTRLCPPLTHERAAALYEALLRDTIGLAAGLDDVQLAIAVTPPGAVDTFRRWSPPGTLLLPIVGADIGECLNQVLNDLLARGHSGAMALNSDGPTLPASHLRQAVARLQEADVVLGPGEDGGYYLIGFREPHPGLFQGIDWSTERVTAQTLARAEALGLSVALLPAWYDVDTAADLDRLRVEVGNLLPDAVPYTRRFLNKQRSSQSDQGRNTQHAIRQTIQGALPYMTTCSHAHLSRYGGLAVGHEDEQKRYFHEKRLYALQIESTDACAQGCLYCYAGSTPQETRGLTSDEIRGLLEDAASLDIRAIDWLGGDPLVRLDWYELMEYAQSLCLINNVWTSGLPLRDQEIARKVYEVTESGFVSVHVDSIHPEMYAQLHRGGNAQYIDQIIQGVDNLLALGKSPEKMINCITYTRHQGPQDAIETMRWWFERKGLRTCLTMFNPAGMGVEWREFEPTTDETRQVYGERDRIDYGDDEMTIAAMDTDKYYCGTMVTVTFTGDVTPCSVIRRGVGNIRETPFRQIVAEHLDTLVHADLHDPATMPAPCNSCDNNEHCWGCRASAYNYHGDANGLDPKCWIVAEYLERQRELAAG